MQERRLGWQRRFGLWQRRLSWQGTRQCEEEKAFQCAVAEWLFVSRHSLLQNGCFTKRQVTQNTGCCRLLPPSVAERVVLPFRWGRKCDLPTAFVPLIKYDQSRDDLRREKAKVELRPTARLNPHPWAFEKRTQTFDSGAHPETHHTRHTISLTHRRPQSFAASGSSVDSSASHTREAAEDVRWLSATGRPPAVCSTSAYASSEAATTGKHACGRHLELGSALAGLGKPGTPPALNAGNILSIRPLLGLPSSPSGPPHRQSTQLSQMWPQGRLEAALSLKPRLASGDRRSLLGQPALGGLALVATCRRAIAAG